MRGSAFGAAKEREVAEMMEAGGWYVIRVAGSLGSADLVCLKAGETPLLVQVKGGDSNTFKNFGPVDRHIIKADAARAGATPLLCKWRKSAKSWEFIGAEAWPPDNPTRHEADYIVDENGCWIWAKATQPDGYGIGQRDHKVWLMHRWYYEQAYGPIPAGLQLDHLCCVRPCVNPEHLEPVTKIVNQLRGRLTKLTPGQVRAIRESDEPAGELAARYGVTRGWVWRLRNGQGREHDAPARRAA